MKKSQIIKAQATWGKAKKALVARYPHLDKDDLEAERQDLLKLAGSKPDPDGRYSVKTLTNTGCSTFLDLCDTTIQGKENKKRKSRSKIWVIENLEMPGIEDREAYLDKIAQDQYRLTSWRQLNDNQLLHFIYTAKRTIRARAKKNPTA